MLKIAILILSTLALSWGDTVTFNNGAVLNGKVTKQTDTTLTIDVNNKKTTYAKSDIKTTTLTSAVSAPPPAVASAPMPITQGVIKAGTSLHVKTLQQIDSRSYQTGQQFKMALDSSIVDENGNVLVKKGTDVYGLVVSSQQAGRLVGESKMVISLSTMSIDSKRISIKTDAINILAPSKQGRDTAKKVVRGAAIGALFNGHEGARDGAKVGAGLAILTRGQSTGVKSGTLLEFRTTTEVTIN